MNISEISENKKQYLDLLLLADEQESMIDRYLDRGTMYVLDEGGVKAVCVVTDEGGGILEIKNIAVAPTHQGKGYGKHLIQFIRNKYKDHFKTLQVGTGDSPLTIPFYEKCGFSKSHSIPNFFINYYDHPIFECGTQLIDMIYLQMDLEQDYRELIDCFVQQNRNILGQNLVGVYLHGSAVMGCFNSQKSDLDFIIVVKDTVSDDAKRAYMDMVVELNSRAPAKGIELSIIRETVCRPFVYPTPFELHFSIAHLDWYQSNPDDYIAKMNGTDKDLAAHFTVLCHRGKALCGRAVREVFAEVESTYYFDSIRSDIENAPVEIMDNPTYIILNLCRVLAFQKEQLILSKSEGGKWGLANLPEKYAGLLSDALTDYETDVFVKPDETLSKEYAAYMLAQIHQHL